MIMSSGIGLPKSLRITAYISRKGSARSLAGNSDDKKDVQKQVPTIAAAGYREIFTVSSYFGPLLSLTLSKVYWDIETRGTAVQWHNWNKAVYAIFEFSKFSQISY